MKTQICNVAGVDPDFRFNVVLVHKGDSYGLDDQLVHDDDDPLVEFYVANGSGEFGLFAARYNAKSLVDPPEWVRPSKCLLLYGAFPKWTVSADGMESVRACLRG